MINWPALLHCHQDTELRYVADFQAFELVRTDGEINTFDQLIDSNGQVFNPCNVHQAGNAPTSLNSLTLEETLGLVKAHAAQAGSCCVAKLYAPTIAAAVVMVHDIDNDLSD